MPTPWVVTLHAHTLDGVLADIHKVGETLELKDEADELVAGLRYRLRRVADRTQGSGRPRVLVLEWLDPPYVAGHWVPELVEVAGGRPPPPAPPRAPPRPPRGGGLAPRPPPLPVAPPRA